MNVLILSAAAKVQLVRAFAEAAHARGGRVFAADLAADNAALFEADAAVLLPRSDDPRFLDALAGCCADHAVRLVVPTRDAELAVLAGAKARFAALGVTAPVPDAEALDLCQDKRRFTAFCAARGLGTPHTYGPREAPGSFPVFVRPVRGAGGKGARRVETTADLPDDDDLLVQALETAPEYTIDVLMDLTGRPLQGVARRRLVVRDGEAVKSRVEDLPAMVDQALALCAALGLVGHNVVQAFHTPQDGARFIEVNPRFGGASNLSFRAGLASPERIMQMVEGSHAAAATPRTITYGLTMLRYGEDRFVTDAELAAVVGR
ncbi:ATP-grasp domain-containing protein [uncultured Phenylobacterium sp.]|uniref:ATP-grasp domain-containing protein n=1 Tax=uncultured Phenylobacterium sp. TaxID=349273 RepID=UPI0025D95CC0|nr:ATP-grasp domain-containing protein [uncultured Phenylobacterium sp.]